MQARGPYHLIAVSIGLFIVGVLTVFAGLTPLFYLFAFVAAVVGAIGVIAAGVSIGVRHAQVLTAESFTSTK